MGAGHAHGGGLMFTTTTHVRGPLFDGRLEREVHAVVDLAVREVTNEGGAMLAAEGRFFRKSGTWESQIRTDRRMGDGVIVDDAVYDAWLAGESSRNQTSRFKGYQHWRKTTHRLQLAAPQIVKRMIQRVL